MRLIEGSIAPEENGAETEAQNDMREEIRGLREQLRNAQRETATAKRDASRAMGELRRQLGPLYKALQMVFGELEAAGVDGDEAAPNASPRVSAVWAVWKDKLGKGPAKAIDALLLHGAMTRKQLAVATGYSPQNVSNIISDLNKASLITKDGDRVTLRTL